MADDDNIPKNMKLIGTRKLVIVGTSKGITIPQTILRAIDPKDHSQANIFWDPAVPNNILLVLNK